MIAAPRALGRPKRAAPHPDNMSLLSRLFTSRVSSKIVLMNPFVDRLLRAWTNVDELVRLEDRFAELYTDPVRVNGSNLTLVDLVARARSLHAAFSELGADVVQVVEDGLAPVTTVRSPPFSGRSLIRALGPLHLRL